MSLIQAMKNNWRLVLALAVLGVIAVLLTACAGASNRPDYNLYGSWREAKTGTVLEFHQDGTMIVPQTAGIASVRYDFSGAGSILISQTPDTAADQRIEWKYTISGDTLTLNLQAQDQTTGQATQQSITLKRIK
jgi:hypothetical protein